MVLNRYIFKEILLAALMSVGLFVFILVAGNAVRDVIGLLAGGKMAWGGFFQVMFQLVLYVVTYALPMGILLGVLLVLGRLSADHEIVALKAAGLSLYRIMVPILVMACMGVVASIVINFYYSPMAKRGYREYLANVIKDNPLQYIRSGTFIKEFDGYVIYVGGQKDGELRDFWIWELDEARRVNLFFRADRANFTYDEAGDALVMSLVDASGEKRKEGDPEDMQDLSTPTLFFKEWSVKLPMSELMGNTQVTRKLSMLTYSELMEARDVAKAEGDYRQQIKVQAQIQKNFAGAFSILSFVVIGIPLGIKVSRRETYANVAVALVLALAFYVMMVLVTWLENQPQWRPDLLVWVPNIVYQSVGWFFIWKMNKN